MVQIVFLANVMSDEMIGNGTFTKTPTTTIGTTSTTITTITTTTTKTTTTTTTTTTRKKEVLGITYSWVLTEELYYSMQYKFLMKF